MIYIVYKMDGDVSGHWDESYFVDDYFESITQDIIDKITNKWRIKADDVNKIRWIEIEDYSNLDPYSSVIFFNDKIASKNLNKSYGIGYTNSQMKNDLLEKAILDYKTDIRDEKIDIILMKKPT